MKQFAIIGLGAFGVRMLEELLTITDEIIIIDKDKEIINKYKDFAKSAYVTDAINEIALTKIIPPEIDAVIVDLGGKIEVSIMTTNYLKKMGIKDIVVKAQTDEHGEVLTMVGATKVVFPDQEAAKRITPMLASSLLFNFMPISANLALAEVKANEFCVERPFLRQISGRRSVSTWSRCARSTTVNSFLSAILHTYLRPRMFCSSPGPRTILRDSQRKRKSSHGSIQAIFSKICFRNDSRRLVYYVRQV